MQQIADWLEKLNLGQYAQRFAENDIDVSVLRHLTDADLEKIGVSLGHRRKILAAIAELPGASPSKHEPADGVEPKPQETAERRQVTVMFSDLVGSTALSARMDPEDLREVISAYQNCVAETVGRLGGFIAKFMGDGVLVYFGYPHAHEDDAERAVRAGLKLIAAVSDLKTHAALQTRVGIATGLVVVGDLIGSGEAQERGIVGSVPPRCAPDAALAPDEMIASEGPPVPTCLASFNPPIASKWIAARVCGPGWWRGPEGRCHPMATDLSPRISPRTGRQAALVELSQED